MPQLALYLCYFNNVYSLMPLLLIKVLFIDSTFPVIYSGMIVKDYPV